MDPLLQKCIDRNIPLLCIDPDMKTVNPDGSIFYMPGTVAQRYEQLGGKSIYFGKPSPVGFEECVQRLGLDKSRIVHVGDSLHHDVAGARAAGLACALVLGGVHRPELGHNLGQLASRDKLQALFQKEGQTPTHVAPLFQL